jgi:hypothetical protein
MRDLDPGRTLITAIPAPAPEPELVWLSSEPQPVQPRSRRGPNRVEVEQPKQIRED